MPTQVRREIVLEGPLYVAAAGALDLEQVFGRRAPVVVDLGSARARFFINVAPVLPEVDFLGIEMRKKRVEGALERLAKHGITNARMLWSEALAAVRDRLPERSVAAFTILYPDPWPKPRHERRRVYQHPDTIELLASRLSPGGLVYVKSDAREYFDAIGQSLAASPRFAPSEDAVVEVAGLARFDLSVPQETYYEGKWRAEGRPLFQAAFRRVEPGA